MTDLYFKEYFYNHFKKYFTNEIDSDNSKKINLENERAYNTFMHSFNSVLSIGLDNQNLNIEYMNKTIVFKKKLIKRYASYIFMENVNSCMSKNEYLNILYPCDFENIFNYTLKEIPLNQKLYL